MGRKGVLNHPLSFESDRGKHRQTPEGVSLAFDQIWSLPVALVARYPKSLFLSFGERGEPRHPAQPGSHINIPIAVRDLPTTPASHTAYLNRDKTTIVRGKLEYLWRRGPISTPQGEAARGHKRSEKNLVPWVDQLLINLQIRSMGFNHKFVYL